MRKVLVVLAGLLLCAAATVIVVGARGAEKTETVKGKVVSVDVAAKQIVIELKDGTLRTVKVADKVPAWAQKGERITAYLSAGSDTATKIKRTRNRRNRERRNQDPQ